MKRILMFVCLAVLVFTATSSVLAEGTIGIDLIPGGTEILALGKIEGFTLTDEKQQMGKFMSYFMRFEGTVEDFKYGVDFGKGTDEFKSGDIILSDSKYDFNMGECKFGARVLNNERVKLDLMLYLLKMQLENSSTQVDMTGALLGCDVSVFISDKVSLDGSVGYSLFGATYEENGTSYDPAFLATLKARINYAVSEHIALSLGLRGTSCVVSNYTTDGLWRIAGGFLVGVRYTF